MALLNINYKIVCDNCKEGLDFEINFPDTIHGIEEISIKPCDCQSKSLKLKEAIQESITELLRLKEKL
jgi:hypothetical protein